jgi:hypothetical protein
MQHFHHDKTKIKNKQDKCNFKLTIYNDILYVYYEKYI